MYDSPSTGRDARDLRMFLVVMAGIPNVVRAVLPSDFCLLPSAPSLWLDLSFHRQRTDVPFDHRHLNRVGGALLDAIAVRARPLERRFEHARLVLGAQR